VEPPPGVSVGTPVAWSPPLKFGPAALPRPAPTLDVIAKAHERVGVQICAWGDLFPQVAIFQEDNMEAAGVEPDACPSTNRLMAQDFRGKILIPRRFPPSIESPGVPYGPPESTRRCPAFR
jgi:hypothetical protein